MPYKSKAPCRHTGCPELVETGQLYCDAHRPLHKEEAKKPSSGSYGSRWQRARKKFLAVHPLCENCKQRGVYVKATDVDHITPHRGDPQLFWDQSNWRALCHSCHSRKTAREDTHPTYHY